MSKKKRVKKYQPKEFKLIKKKAPKGPDDEHDKTLKDVAKIEPKISNLVQGPDKTKTSQNLRRGNR